MVATEEWAAAEKTTKLVLVRSSLVLDKSTFEVSSNEFRPNRQLLFETIFLVVNIRINRNPVGLYRLTIV